MTGLGSPQEARDRGSVLIGELTAMIMTGLLLSSVVGVMWLSVRLVRTAPPAHNPTVYGTLVASGSRLGDSLSQPLVCSNPLGEPTRTGCLDVGVRQLKPIADPALRDPATAADRQAIGDDAMCWAVTTDRVQTSEKRRLECWQRLHSGYLQAWVHPPKTSLGDTTDYLFFKDDQWEPSPDSEWSRNVASGLTAVEWLCLDPDELEDWQEHQTAPSTGISCSRWVAPPYKSETIKVVELLTCASIKPEQRNLMKEGFVPFCDGTIGVDHTRPDPATGDWAGIEGYLLPPVRVYTSGS